MPHAAPLLEKHRIFQSRDAEATQAFLHSCGFTFDLPGRAGTRAEFDAHLNGVYMPNLWLGYSQYGAAAEIRTTPVRDEYWVHLPVRGNVTLATGRRQVDCSVQLGCILSPNRQHFISSAADSARIQLAINADVLKRHLSMLLGDTISRPVEFTRRLDLSSGLGRNLSLHVMLAVREFEQAGVTWPSDARTRFEQYIMTELLLAQPHGYSDALQKRSGALAPRDVKRVIDFIHDNLGAPISLTDLVTASGVAGRTLFQHFRDFKGCSPMRYVRETRLARAEQLLRASGPSETVTSVAMHCGISHMGRFSVEYRKRFGQSPSQTLAERHAAPDTSVASTVRRAWLDERGGPRPEIRTRGALPD